MKLILTGIFTLLYIVAQSQIRTFYDRKDREFLQRKLLEIVRSVDTTQFAAPFDLSGNNITISMNFRSGDSAYLRKSFVESSYVIVGILHSKALKYFPELHTLTIKSKAKDKKEVSVVYQLFPDGSIGYITEFGKPRIAQYPED